MPEGWKIEVNDTRITEELTAERKLSGKKLQRTFINRFNGQLKDALKECVWREKCSSGKDKRFRFKAILSAAVPLGHFSFESFEAVIGTGNIDPFDVLGPSLINYALCNLTLRYIRRTNIDYLWEYPMPFVEIDKVGRTFAYLAGKGRKLVREVTP